MVKPIVPTPPRPTDNVVPLDASLRRGELLGHVIISGEKREVRSITVREYVDSGLEMGAELVGADAVIKLTAISLGVTYGEVENYDYFEAVEAFILLAHAAERLK